MAQDKTIIKCLLMLKAAYPRQALEDVTIDTYEMLLRDIEPGLLKAAVLQVITESVFFPTVAEIRQKVNEMRLKLSGVPDAYQAWAAALSCAQGRTNWRELPAGVQATIQDVFGDTYNFKMSTTLAADRARFIEAYNATVNRETREMNLLPETRRILQLEAGNGAADRQDNGS